MGCDSMRTAKSTGVVCWAYLDGWRLAIVTPDRRWVRVETLAGNERVAVDKLYSAALTGAAGEKTAAKFRRLHHRLVREQRERDRRNKEAQV